MVTSVGSLSGGSGAAQKGARTISEMSPEQFLNLLITQLQNQDPFEPVKNQDLLEQISAVRQLQSSMDLSSTLTSLVLQQQIASAGSLIGKQVTGLNASLDQVNGLVTSLRVEQNDVYLELDTGQRVALKDITRVAEVSASGGGAA